MEINVTNRYTEISMGGGKFLTYKRPTMFPQFFSRKILASGESADDFREVTADERAKMEAGRDAWVRPPQELIERWNALCKIAHYNGLDASGNIIRKVAGRYNEATGFFELYGTFLDITAEEALWIIEVSTAWQGTAQSTPDGTAASLYHRNESRPRALLPIACDNSVSLRSVNKISLIALNYYYPTRPVPVSNLRQYDVERCVTPMDVSGISYKAGNTEGFYSFGLFGGVKYILLHNLKCDWPLERCANIEIVCIEYAVDHAANTKPITITLHADAFARCTPELLAKAEAKNITITTP